MLIYGITYYFIINFVLNNLNDNYKYNTYVIAFFHAISSSMLCMYNLYKKEYLDYYSENTYFDNIVISNSIGYFLTDLIKCLYEKDTIFIVHHIVGIVFLMSSYIYQVAGTSAVGGLLVGEVSNPILHLGWFLKYYKQQCYITVWKFNTFLFCLFRICLSPLIIYNFLMFPTEYIAMKYIMLLSYTLFYNGSMFWFVKQMNTYLKRKHVN